jgi:hypothetical protein
VIEKYGKDFVRMYEKKPESPWLFLKIDHSRACSFQFGWEKE